MNTDTRYDHLSGPDADGFEDRLLAAILDDSVQRTSAATLAPRRGRNASGALSRISLYAIGAAATAAFAIAVVAVAGAGKGAVAAHGSSGAGPATKAGVVHGQSGPVYKLAAASAAAPALDGRYFVLSESDNETDQTAPSERTSVLDAQTGASVTYQQVPAGSQIPGILREGADSSSTEAWFQALPTDPASLRAKLLDIAERQQQQTEVLMQQKDKKLLAHISSHALKARLTAPARLTDDQLVYQEANDLLWSPLVQPDLRSALYKVIAGTGGYTVDANATDPSGRAAVSMTNTSTLDGITETDVIYEDPTTGVVLAQTWKTGSSLITAVYQTVTTSDTLPADPYAG